MFWKYLTDTIWFRFKEVFSFGNKAGYANWNVAIPMDVGTLPFITENAVFSGRTGKVSPINFQNQSIERVGYCSGGGNL